MFDSVKQISTILTAVFSFAVVILWCTDRVKRYHFFIITYGIVLTLGFSFLSLAEIGEQGRFCRNNAETITTSDGLSLCLAEAMVFVFMVVFCPITFGLQGVEMYRKTVLKKLSPPKVAVYAAVMFTVPTISVILCYTTGILGSEMGRNYCGFTTEAGNSPMFFVAFLLPMCLFAFVGIVCVASVAYNLIAVQLSQKSTSAWMVFRTAAISMKFVSLCAAHFVLMVGLAPIYADLVAQNRILVSDWGSCLLTHFPSGPTVAFDSCGSLPPRAITAEAQLTHMALDLAGLGTFFFVVVIDSVVAVIAGFNVFVKVKPADDQIPVSDGESSDDECDTPGMARSERVRQLQTHQLSSSWRSSVAPSLDTPVSSLNNSGSSVGTPSVTIRKS